LVHKKYIYFLGIGGIGMSALARYFHTQEYVVAGYDKTPSVLTNKLQEEGINVSFADDVAELPREYVDDKNATMVVYTPAIPVDNVLFNFFKKEEYSD
jgi:UDP-N-acetylmuramate--alanine ligase